LSPGRAERARHPPARAASGARVPARARGSRKGDGHTNPMNAKHFVPIVGLLALASCSKPAVEEVETKAAAPVTTLTVAPQTFEGVVSAAGTVSAAPGADWTITAPEHARIVEITKAEGDRVQKGDVLVRFEIPSLETDVTTHRGEAQAAQAHLDNAQANVTRL